MKVCDNHESHNAIGIICSLWVSVSHFVNFCDISSFFIITMFVMVICDQRSLLGLAEVSDDA